MDKRASVQRPFGMRTFVQPDESGELTLRWNKGKGPISIEKVTAGYEMVDKWKVIVSRVGYEHAGFSDKEGQRRILSVLEILKPKEVCTETYSPAIPRYSNSMLNGSAELHLYNDI